MEQRTVKLTLNKAKEWYKQDGELKEVALQAFTEKELKDYRSHSWEEFCINHPLESDSNNYFIYSDSSIRNFPNSAIGLVTKIRDFNNDRNLYPTKRYAEAALAMCQLLQLRFEWVHNYAFKWYENDYYCITRDEELFPTVMKANFPRVLSFPDYDTACEFYSDFRSLIEIAKPLL